MKILPSLPAPALLSKHSNTTVSREAPSSQPATQVTLSDDARFIASVAREAREGREVRLDVVERTTAALLDGSFERNIDMDALIKQLAGQL